MLLSRRRFKLLYPGLKFSLAEVLMFRLRRDLISIPASVAVNFIMSAADRTLRIACFHVSDRWRLLPTTIYGHVSPMVCENDCGRLFGF